MQEREDILRLHATGLPTALDVDLASIAAGCHGYSGADLAAVCREAAMRAICEAVQKTPDGQSTGLVQCRDPGRIQSLGSKHCAHEVCSHDLAIRTTELNACLNLLLCGAADVVNLTASLEVSSKDFQAALQRVPPSLTRGKQILSETGTPQCAYLV